MNRRDEEEVAVLLEASSQNRIDSDEIGCERAAMRTDPCPSGTVPKRITRNGEYYNHNIISESGPIYLILAFSVTLAVYSETATVRYSRTTVSRACAVTIVTDRIAVNGAGTRIERHATGSEMDGETTVTVALMAATAPIVHR